MVFFTYMQKSAKNRVFWDIVKIGKIPHFYPLKIPPFWGVKKGVILGVYGMKHVYTHRTFNSHFGFNISTCFNLIHTLYSHISNFISKTFDFNMLDILKYIQISYKMQSKAKGNETCFKKGGGCHIYFTI